MTIDEQAALPMLPNTALEQTTEIYRILNVPSVTSVINGKIYKGRRPANSTAEDIVINTLTTGDGTRQFGVSMVNVYCPDILTTVDGKQVYQADTARLKTISDVVKPLLNETDTAALVLWINSSELVAEEEVYQHFLNFRVEVQMYNHS